MHPVRKEERSEGDTDTAVSLFRLLPYPSDPSPVQVQRTKIYNLNKIPITERVLKNKPYPQINADKNP
jgi:hypothetical protein